MNIDELKSRWQADAPNGVLPERTESEMLDYVKQRQRRFRRQLLFRDGLETLAAVVVFGLFAMWFPAVGWFARSGLLLVMASCVFIVWRLHATRRRRGGAADECPVTEVLRTEIERTGDQIRLLKTVLWWYFSPIAVGAMLVVAGIRGMSSFTLWYALGVVMLGAGIHYLNQLSVRRELEPRRRELESMLAAMESDDYAGRSPV